MRPILPLVCLMLLSCSVSEQVERDEIPQADTVSEVGTIADLARREAHLPDLAFELPGEVREAVPEAGPELMTELPLEVTAELHDLWSETETSSGFCGDEECLGDEYCDTCPEDCGECTVCGNGLCEPGQPLESPETCGVDCGGCGDGLCSVNELEEDGFCHADCGYACGDGVCNETEQAFDAEDIDYCPVDCGGCYDGVCGYQDLTNPELADCMMADCSTLCGNGICASGETWEECPVDCPVCGDGVCGKVGKGWESCPLDCDKPCGDGLCEGSEAAEECPADCGPCGDGICSIAEAKYGGCVADCPDTCGNKHCDGIENEDTCPSDCACKPECNEEWECGEDDNGCGEPCGGCPDGAVCIEHLCCVPDCKLKECGGDGCGGSCGECGGAENAVCVNYSCECVPDCAGKQCGGDGCLGSCGACDDGLFCTADLCEGGACTHEAGEGHCLVTLLGQPACAEAGTVNPANSCEACAPDVDKEGWSPREDGIQCAPGMHCFAGACCNHAAHCLGRECGDDGCGSDCGQCSDGEKCWEGQCIEEDCTPDCSGKECGGDGCGGSCGECDDWLFCTADSCAAGTCSFEVQAGFCVAPVGPGFPACAPDGAEHPESPCLYCNAVLEPADWTPRPDGQPCENGECQGGVCEGPCVPVCFGKQCGDDGCGGSCGGCPFGKQCVDGLCESGCIEECPLEGTGECLDGSTLRVCGDWDPDPCLEWAQLACPDNCANGSCDGCVPDCAGKECGDNGCGASCGDCGPWECENGMCQVEPLTCAQYMECLEGCGQGDPNCEGVCMELTGPLSMQQLAAWEACLEAQCGPNPLMFCEMMARQNGCAAEWQACQGCEPDCSGKACGDDGCGGSCGGCTIGWSCIDGTCVCQPNCNGKECGSDFCGGSCGDCPVGEGCLDFQCHPTCVDPEDIFYDGCQEGFASEAQVNQTTVNQQTEPAIAAFPKGGFVVVWQSEASNPADVDVYGRMFTKLGEPFGSEFLVSEPSTEVQSMPDVATFSDGRFIVAYENHETGDDKRGIAARLFGVTGIPQGDEFLLYPAPGQSAGYPSVTTFPIGNFSAAWSDQVVFPGDIIALTNAYGYQHEPLAEAQPLAGFSEFGQFRTAAVRLPAHGYVAAFESCPQNNYSDPSEDGTGCGVFARTFSEDGTALSSAFQLSQEGQDLQAFPALAPRSESAFAAFWEDHREGADKYRVYGRMLSWQGSGLGDEFLASEEGWWARSPAADGRGGNVVAAWQAKAGMTYYVVARKFGPWGEALGDARVLHLYTDGNQGATDVAMFADGSYAAVWQSDRLGGEPVTMGQDGHGAGIFVSRFTAEGDWCPVGECETGEAPGCVFACGDGGKECLVSKCDKWAGSCVNKLNEAACDDDDVCTDDVCHFLGNCQHTAVDCDDGDPCTKDLCDAVNGCTHAPLGNGAFCSDGNQCTLNDTCQAGICTGGMPAVCDDGNACTDDTCDPAAGCQHAVAAPGTPCSDGNACTENDGCSMGFCVPGGAVVCSTANPCMEGNCHLALGCQFVPKMDGLSCGGGATCKSGVCGECDDGNPTDWDGCTGHLLSEFQVNEYSAGSQGWPGVAAFSDGSFAAVWYGVGETDTNSVWMRRFGSDGKPLTSDEMVNTTTSGFAAAPRLAALPDDFCVVAWYGEGVTDTNGIFARVYDADGIAQGDEFQVASTVDTVQAFPDVAIMPGGGFVVAWQSNGQAGDVGNGVWGRYFDASANPRGAEFHLSNQSDGGQRSPSVVGLPGDVAAWSWHLEMAGDDIFSRITLSPEPSAFAGSRVNVFSEGDQEDCSLTPFGDCGYVAIWRSEAQDGDLGGIYARRFSAYGRPATDGFAVNSHTAGDQANPEAAVLDDGRMVAVWHGPGESGDYGIHGRVFGADGTPESAQWQANVFGQQFKQRAVVAAVGLRGYVVAWEGWFQDGGGQSGIYARRYNADGTTCPLGEEFEVAAPDCAGGCADSNPCTIDYCPAGQDCQHDALPDDTPCGVGQACQAGVCTGDDYTCDDGNADDWDGCTAGVQTEFRVNTYGDGEQSRPTVAAVPGGESVIAWQSWEQDGDDWGVYAQFFDADGAGQGEVQVNVSTLHYQYEPTAMADGDGHFIIAWTGKELAGGSADVFGSKFLADGTPVAEEVVMTPSLVSGSQSEPFLMPLSAGSSMLLFRAQNTEVFGQRFLAQTGSPAVDGTHFALIPAETASTPYPRGAAQSAGKFVAVWTSDLVDASSKGAAVRLFDADDVPAADAFAANTYTSGLQQTPDVAVLADDVFVVVWDSIPQDGQLSGIFAQMFDADGTRVGDEFQVNQYWQVIQERPRVIAGVGAFVVVWSGYGPDDTRAVSLRWFNAAGEPISNEARFNMMATLDMDNVDAVAGPPGQSIIVWQAEGKAIASGPDVFARRF